MAAVQAHQRWFAAAGCTQPLEHFAQRNTAPVRRLTPDALTTLLRHTWPGNIRELENLLSRAALLAGPGGLITAADFPAGMGQPEAPVVAAGVVASAPAGLAGRTLLEIERDALVQTLAACRQNRAQTARMLGVSEKTVYNMMHRHQLVPIANMVEMAKVPA